VLNYLGYSWIDQGINLHEGMRMIKRAVEPRADDGSIVDSLGWAYYRLGNMDEAVKQLERAVELKPGDPTINDHLGDAYWRVGRVLEARFQWTHARDLKPEPEDLVKIEAKLKSGLPDDTAPLGERASRGLLIFSIGIGATLAWQSYGDAARAMPANSSPQLGWLALQTAPLAQTTPSMVVPPADPLNGPDSVRGREACGALFPTAPGSHGLAAPLSPRDHGPRGFNVETWVWGLAGNFSRQGEAHFVLQKFTLAAVREPGWANVVG
jgi:TPR repeat